MKLYEKSYCLCDMTDQSCSIGGYRTATATKNARYLLLPPKKDEFELTVLTSSKTRNLHRN